MRAIMFVVKVKALNPKDETVKSVAIDAQVDTESELTWLPRQILEKIGIESRREREFLTLEGERIIRHVGYAILEVDNFQTIDEVVFAEQSDMALLGERTVGGFGVFVDNIGHRLVPQETIAC